MSEEPKTPENANGGGNEPGNGAQAALTQAEIDAIVKDRVARERAKYADYDELKAKAQKFSEWEESQKTELEKAQEAAQKAAREKDSAIALANERLIKATFIEEASKHGVAHPEDAYALASRESVAVDQSGTVSGVADAVKELIDGGRLVLNGKPQAPGLNGGAGGEQRPSEKAKALTDDQRAVAQKLGISEEAYQKQISKE